MKINLAMEGLPRFTALDEPEADYTLGYNGALLISPSIDYLERLR